MIQLTQISKEYSHQGQVLHALKNVDLHVKQGEIFGIMGKSGAGKSTLLRCVNLLERPTSGTVQVAGQELTSMRESELRVSRRQIGMIFQHFNLLNSATTYENIALPLVLAGLSESNIRKTVAPLLELTGLEDKIEAYPAQLSGGQKQRVAIARALVHKPQVLLCDEATSALDQETTRSILDMLRSINEEFGLTILLITHEMDVIKTICERVAVMEGGEIKEQNTLVGFLMSPQSSMGITLSKAAIQQELPLALRKRLISDLSIAQGNPLLRIFFQGTVAETPMIAALIKKFSFKLNILQASMEYIQHQPLGIILLEVMNYSEKLPEAIEYLQQNGILTEVIGYVNPPIFAAA